MSLYKTGMATIKVKTRLCQRIDQLILQKDDKWKNKREGPLPLPAEKLQNSTKETGFCHHHRHHLPFSLEDPPPILVIIIIIFVNIHMLSRLQC